MKENVSNGRGCPSSETLSAFFDGELPASSEISAHLSTCPECRKRLDVYEMLAAKIKSRMTSVTADNLEDRIKSLVHERLELERTRPEVIRFRPVGLRIAAAMVIGLGVSLYVAGRFFNVAEPVSPPPSNLVKTDQRPATGMDPASSATSHLNPGGTVFLSNLKPVSLDGRPSGLNMTAETRRRSSSRPTAISNRVHHVWVVHDLAKVEGDLERFAREHHIPSKKMKMVEDGDKVKLNLRLTKRELVDLTRLCADSGLELLSPQAPQPEQREFIGNGDDSVQYNADFVLNMH